MNRLSVVSLLFLLIMATLSCAVPSQAGKEAPAISSVSPASAVAGGSGFSLTVSGSNFSPNSVVLFNGMARATTFISKTLLSASILDTDIAHAGTAQVVVANPKPFPEQSNSFSLAIQASPAPLQIATNSLPSAIVQLPYNANVAVNGGIGPYTWKLASGQLPPGLAISAWNGVISGAPGQAGKFNFTTEVTDSSPLPQTASQALALSVAPSPNPLLITTTTLPNGTVQAAYSATLAASGGVTPYSWNVGAGSLPPGLTLTASTGSIAGAPTQAGGYSFTAQVRDSSPLPQSATMAFSLTVNPAASAVSVAISPTSASLLLGQTLPFTATVTGSANTSVTWSVNGVVGGNATVGTISSSGLYTAPAALPSPATVTVTATSVTDTSKSSSASVTVSAPPPPAPSNSPAALPSASVDVSMPVQTGAVINVPAGGDFQGALNGATCGDTIQLAAGATYTGNFVLPNKSCTGWVVIRTSASDSSLPPPGTRITPSYASVMSKIATSNTTQAILTTPGAHHYRFIGIEFASTGDIFDLISLDPSDYWGTIGIARSMTSLSEMPSYFVFDRCYIHGNTTGNQQRGISMQCANCAVIESHISDFHYVGADSQAIASWTGSGPFLIRNNYLAAAGENVIFGGADTQIQNLVPSDITVVRNHLWKDTAWRCFTNCANAYSVKNLLELKNARRVLVDGNVMEYSWVGGQRGYAVLLTPRNQNGGNPWAAVEDVTITHNIMRHAGSGIDIAGADNIYSGAGNSLPTARVLIQNNLLNDINAATWTGDGRLTEITSTPGFAGPHDITFDHNTGFVVGQSTLTMGDCGTLSSAGVCTTQFSGVRYTNNITSFANYGVIGDQTSSGLATFTGYLSQFGYVWNKNALISDIDFTSIFPAGTFFPTLSGVGFVNYTGGDYHLSASSPYKNAGTDGKDLGADIDALAAATAGVI